MIRLTESIDHPISGNTTNTSLVDSFSPKSTGGSYIIVAASFLFLIIFVVMFVRCTSRRQTGGGPWNDEDYFGSWVRAMERVGSVRPVVREEHVEKEATVEEKVAVYEQIFETSRNQLQLRDDHIIRKESSSSSEKKERGPDSTIDIEAGQHHDDEHEQEFSQYLVLERSNEDRRRSSSLSNNNSGKTATTGTKRRSSIFHPSHMVPVQGSCAICIENFQVGDLVVWSETKSCPHVFHKSCIVGYFAHNKSGTTNKSTNNPCPTCRQKFCTLPCTTDETNQSEDDSVVTTSTSSPSSDANESITPDVELGSS